MRVFRDKKHEKPAITIFYTARYLYKIVRKNEKLQVIQTGADSNVSRNSTYML